jgi:von Willebrand factor type A C-terminal domain/von Willebrand factor type A domain
MPFVIQPFCNAFLANGERRVDVILKVHATLGQSNTAGGPLEYGILLDNSGSMSEHGKMAAAKLAARGAIARIPDGVVFFVVSFDSSAKVISKAAVSSAKTRADADRAVARIEADGGTSMAAALIAADGQFGGNDRAVRVSQLFTDGENGDQDGVLEETLGALKGRFQCECRGIGVGWQPKQLLQIAEALLGTAKGVATGEAMAADLRDTFASAAARRAADVKLRLIVPPKMASIITLRQMSPTIIDLTRQGIAVDDRTHDYPTGAWSDEERDFQVVLELKQAGAVGEQLRVARTAIVLGDAVEDQPAVTVTWSADDSLTALIDPQVAHYSGQAELAAATREGFDALAKGNTQLATVRLGRAMQLAQESGNDDATRRLAKVVDVVDATRGTVRLRAGVQKTDLLDAEDGATRTVRRAHSKPA